MEDDHEAAQAALVDEFRQLSNIALAELESETPTLATVFKNAQEMMDIAKQVDEEQADELWDESICLFEDLVDRHKYRERECRYALAECWYHRANFRQSRLAIEECLAIDSEWEPAVEFAQKLRRDVLREGKTVIYGLAGIAAAASLFLAWRRSR